MDEEMICLDCLWTGLKKDLRDSQKVFRKNIHCPDCGSSHVDYVKRIRRNSAQTKA